MKYNTKLYILTTNTAIYSLLPCVQHCILYIHDYTYTHYYIYCTPNKYSMLTILFILTTVLMYYTYYTILSSH